MKVAEHEEAVFAAIDALATDPDVSNDEYLDSLTEIATRCLATRSELYTRQNV